MIPNDAYKVPDFLIVYQSTGVGTNYVMSVIQRNFVPVCP